LRFSAAPDRQFTDQQIDLTLNYRGYPVISPQDDFFIIVRQNYRDDRIIAGLRPTNVRAFDNTLEYRLIGLENTVPGGNEYRFFDTRSTISRGNYIDRVDRKEDRNVAYVQTDRPRASGTYFQADDFNGLFVIDQRDNGLGNASVSADYLETVFTLQTPELSAGDVYVNGSFNNWLRNDRSRMTYDVNLGAYRATILLKQGVYNYNYVIGLVSPQPGVDEFAFEGSYSGTENDYEVFVYNRPPASRADQLVGYVRVGYNKRR
jgi:hypothetical protein